MNSSESQFINRDEELARIAQGALAWGESCALIVDGVGGIGKSWLLEEAYRRRHGYAAMLNHRLRIAPVMNLDDVTLQIPLNIGRRMANDLGAENFTAYFDATDNVIAVESPTQMTPEKFARQLRHCDDLFMTAYRGLAAAQRIVLFWDTFESVARLPVGDYLAKLAIGLPNTLVLIGGRAGEITHAMLKTAQANAPQQKLHLDYIRLKPFLDRAANDYLAATPVRDYLATQAQLRDNLLFLTEGRPLLLALAAEWLRRDLPLEALTKHTLDELRAMPGATIAQLRGDFERALVAHIRKLHGDTADLILDMAHFHAFFDAQILARITGESLETSRAKIKTLEDFFFVKSKPDGNITLHDEMQRLVTDYVWPQVDPFGVRRHQLSLVGMQHYRQALAELDQRLPDMRAQIERLRQAGDIAGAAQQSRDYLEQERWRWTLLRELLHYALAVDLHKGVALFIAEFDRASNQYKYLLRGSLVEEIKKLELTKLTPPWDFEVNIRIAKHDLDDSEYTQADTRLTELLRRQLTPPQRADARLQLGNVKIRLGNLNEGLELFESAARDCATANIEPELGKAENALGWGYRLMGDLEPAAEHYRKALKIALRHEEMRLQRGWILNNLAFVYAYQNDRDGALSLNDQALKEWSQQGFERAIGAGYSTRGSILYKFGQFEEALEAFAKALPRFELQSDDEWLSTVYCWRGVTYWAIGRLEQARNDLERARNIGLKKDQAIVLNRLARVYRSQNQDATARELLNQAYDAALAIKDRLYEIVSLNDLAHLDADQGNFAALEEYLPKLAAYLNEWAKPDGMALGRLYRHLGTLALGQAKLDQATEYFQQGLVLIARYGSYGWITLDSELADMEKTIAKLAPADYIRALGATMLQHWENEQLDVKHTEALLFFARWQKWAN